MLCDGGLGFCRCRLLLRIRRIRGPPCDHYQLICAAIEKVLMCELTAWPFGPTWTGICPGHCWGRGARRGSARRGLAPSAFAGCAGNGICPGGQTGIRGLEAMPWCCESTGRSRRNDKKLRDYIMSPRPGHQNLDGLCNCQDRGLAREPYKL